MLGLYSEQRPRIVIYWQVLEISINGAQDWQWAWIALKIVLNSRMVVGDDKANVCDLLLCENIRIATGELWLFNWEHLLYGYKRIHRRQPVLRSETFAFIARDWVLLCDT